jgi:hypothetical protein
MTSGHLKVAYCHVISAFNTKKKDKTGEMESIGC